MTLSKDRYVEVAFPMRLNQTFTYRWSLDPVNPLGYRVLVPFQKRTLTGYVLDQSSNSGQSSIKEVQDVLDETPILTPELIRLIHYMTKRYGVSLGEVLQTVIPKARKTSGKRRKPKNVPDILEEMSQPLHLTLEQKAIVDDIEQAVANRQKKTFLLNGVTGSGKTEVYLQAAERCLKLGRNVLALVPEISLTPQFLTRFQKRFGKKIALLHSQRSEAERANEWKRILSGEVQIVVGTRSSIFCPIKNIGLFILDEEHDRSYKQDDHVMYHAKDIAYARAEMENATVVLGSATPSMETFYLAEKGLIETRILSRRIHQEEMPVTEIVDLQKEKSFGEATIFSEKLKTEIQATLQNNKQVILFLNRRGYSTHVYCPLCGSTLQCPYCSISMTYHQKSNSFLCHYCDYSADSEQSCTTCSAGKLIRFGFGTERVERELSFLFPDAVVDRLDRDTTRKKGSFDKVFAKFADRKTDILIGTQMITKGLDFEHVDLVGVLLADQSLQFPDFRAAEHTFQLLTQVIGRSGRGHIRGRAILQTLQPNHYAILAAAKQDYQKFYDEEIEYRRKAFYPPFSKIILFEIKGKQKNAVQQMAHWLRKQMETAVPQNSKVEILGPSPAPIEKIKLNYRVHLFLKSHPEAEIDSCAKWVYAESRKEFSKRSMHLKLNLDPFDFM